jgi:hypothetical protein
VFIDGLHVGEHLVVVALGVDAVGSKHPLGLWEGGMSGCEVHPHPTTCLTRRGRAHGRTP